MALKWSEFRCLREELSNLTHPAKNIRRNHEPGTAKIKMASSVSVSPIRRNGMHARISKLENRKIAFAGAWDLEMKVEQSIMYFFSIIPSNNYYGVVYLSNLN